MSQRLNVGQFPDADIQAMVLQTCSGIAALLISIGAGDLRSRSATAVVAVVAVVAGGAIGALPWHRWRESASRWIIPEALALCVAFNIASGAPYLYSIFYLVVWCWVGLSQPPGVALRYAPLLTVAYLVPAFTYERVTPVVVSAACVIPICILLGEAIAAGAEQLRANQTELERAAYADLLTGLGNRAQLHRHLRECITEGYVPDALFLDLDGFKVVNDSLGHPVGDRLLQAVTRRVMAVVGTENLFRVGGDEFVALSDSRDASTPEVASRVVAAFQKPFEVDERRLPLGVSVGVATGDVAMSVDDLLHHADLAMYRAKKAGGRRWAFFDGAMAASARDRLELETSLRAAVGADELVLEFQPLIKLATGEVVGAEALVRWDHATRGRLGPDAFIGVAERSGVIEELGDWVLREALGQARRWLDAGRDLGVAVNVSPVQLRQPSYVGAVAVALRDAGLEPERLHIEITEGTLIDPEVAEGALPALRAMGVAIDIDDFGTGYSSLSYLERLDVDTLKVDRSFLSASRDGLPSPIVGAIVAMARNLGLSVVAEGVETSAQLSFVRELGVDYAEGYLFARPMPADDFLELIQRGGVDTAATALHTLG